MDAGQDKNTRERFISVLGFDYNTNRSIIDLLSRKKQRHYYLGLDCRSRRLIELSLLIKAAQLGSKPRRMEKSQFVSEAGALYQIN